MILHKNSPRLSVIIPTLNEESGIEKCLKTVLRPLGIEVIVVDGGSTDATLEKLKGFEEIKVIQGPSQRAKQCNLGAKEATSDQLMFVHADSLLPPGYEEEANRILRLPGVVAGAFGLSVEIAQPYRNWIETLVDLRSRWLKLPYGDQGLFVNKKTFQQLGGYPEMPIMEDFQMVQNLKKLGEIQLSEKKLVTSGRRWQRLGVLKTTWINQKVVLGYHLGVSAETLADWYQKPVRKRRNG